MAVTLNRCDKVVSMIVVLLLSNDEDLTSTRVREIMLNGNNNYDCNVSGTV